MAGSFSDRLLARFSRVTSTGKFYVPQLDGIRCLAISWVVAIHVAMYMAERTGLTLRPDLSHPLIFLFDAGRSAVDMFFVISGFVLAIPFARQYLGQGKPVRLGTYFSRRLTRLEPPYMIHLLITLGAWAAFGTRTFAVAPLLQSSFVHEVPRHLLASLVYCHQFIYQTMPYPNVVLWSLEIEVQFYILAPVLTMVFAIANPTLRRTVIVGGMLGWSLVPYRWDYNFVLTHSLAGYLQEFLAGFLLVDLYLTSWQDGPAGSRTWDALSLVGWVGIILCDWLGSSRFLVLPWSMLLAYVGAFRGVAVRSFLANRWLATIGGMCCTIYMYHGGIIIGLGRKTWHYRTGILWVDMILQSVMLWVLVLMICSVLFLLFERPFMRPDWHKRLWAKVLGREWPAAKPAEARQAVGAGAGNG